MERTEGGAERGERVRALDPAAAESEARRAWCCTGPAAAMADEDAEDEAADRAATDPDPELGGVEGTERERPTGAKDEPEAEPAEREGMLMGALMPCDTAEGHSSTGPCCCCEDEDGAAGCCEEEEDSAAAATTGASAERLSCCALLVGMSVGPGTLCNTDATLLRGEARGALLLLLPLLLSAAEAGTVAPLALEDTLVGLVEGGVPVDDDEEEAEACSSGEDDDTERCDEGAG